MRLLQIQSDGELSFTKFFIHGKDKLPPYVILSHTWESNHHEEVIFSDLSIPAGNQGTDHQDTKLFTELARKKKGYRKIQFCADQAKHDGFQFFWVDSCCINKPNFTELNESLISMFRWYQDAQECYVYLADVASKPTHNRESSSDWKHAFRGSRWFTRGWTLQELIAPATVQFFTFDGQRLGDKRSLGQTIHEITHIPPEALRGGSLSEFTVAERKSWGHGRETSRPEDSAYCLLGMLDVSMCPMYGEGRDAAFRRLEKEILLIEHGPVHDPQLEANLDKCLADLRLSDPQDDKSRIEATKGGLLKDSYRWVLQNHDFQQWRSDQESHLLWIKGDPGKGKTMLLCGIIDELCPSTNSHPAIYFFCQATDAKLNNAVAVLRGLMYMLVKQRRSLLKHLQEEWKIAGKRLFEDGNAWQALTRIFTAMMKDQKAGKLTFVVDALDECSQDLPKLLDFIMQQSSQGHAKWLVSSRNELEIEEKLDHVLRKVRLCLELNEASVSAAVKVYIGHESEKLKHIKKLDEGKKNEIMEYLNLNAGHTFLWVALVCQRLKGPKMLRGSVMSELRCYPAGLDPLYQRMMDLIDDLPHAGLCRKILSTISTVYRPVSLLELEILLQSEESFESLDDLEEVIRCCGSFLAIRNQIVYFVHQSAKDFLEKTAVGVIYPHGIRQKNLSIFDASITALSRFLRRDICNLREPGIAIGETPSTLPSHLEKLRYCCVFWVDHLPDGELLGHHYDSIGRFLEGKFLYWLEALSLLRTPISVPALTKLCQRIQDCNHSGDLRELVSDGLRFARYHGSMISQYPLQTYATALVFTPTETIIRHVSRREEPQWLVLKPQVEKKWSALQQTLEGHTDGVLSVAFSPDGRQVASASLDNTVRIWATDTGALQQTLEGHTDGVLSVAFSPDGRQVASASWDKTVRIWATYTGALQQTLKGHTSRVESVAFSPDGRQVVSASDDTTVRIWATYTGALQQTLKGHTNCVESVAFSPDGRQVVSASRDKTVRIWATYTGALQQTLKGHTDCVESVAFSPDGRQVVSASRDKTVRIWATYTGALQQTLKGHTDCVESVAFSPDGRQVVSASRDKTVRIWVTDTGALQQTLKGHTDRVESVAFSPDGRQVASVSWDNTVRIWATDTGALQQTLEGHTDRVESVAFSPDGRQVASVSWDSMVRIWATDTGALQQTIKAVEACKGILKFTSDGIGIPTSVGQFNLQINSSFPARALHVGFNISEERWITYNGKRILSLPASYRPAASAIVGSTVAIGCCTGRVLILRFSESFL